MADQMRWGVNLYDSDGDVVDEGIWLFFGNAIIKVADSLDDLKVFSKQLAENIPEIEAECQRVGL